LALVLYSEVLDPTGPTTTTTLMLAALTSWGLAIAPRLTTIAVIRANAVRRGDRWLDALWATFVGTGKILASFFQNTALGRGDGGEAAMWQGRACARETDARSIAVSASEGLTRFE
jgi:drug/metabolite transporter (DMT)-like permease